MCSNALTTNESDNNLHIHWIPNCFIISSEKVDHANGNCKFNQQRNKKGKLSRKCVYGITWTVVIRARINKELHKNETSRKKSQISIAHFGGGSEKIRKLHWKITRLPLSSRKTICFNQVKNIPSVCRLEKARGRKERKRASGGNLHYQVSSCFYFIAVWHLKRRYQGNAFSAVFFSSE